MNKREILNDLIKKIISCNTQYELKEIVKDINDFINDYSIVNNSNEYKRLKNAVGIMRIKLKILRLMSQKQFVLLSLT